MQRRGQPQGLPLRITAELDCQLPLDEQLTALVDRVAAIGERLEPGTTTDGVCVQYSQYQLQSETVTKYLDAINEDVGSLVTLKKVLYNIERGLTTHSFEEAFTDHSIV